jgi:serine/threonine protein kinase/tetratricopeptide (TPR) repeat protein
MGVSNSDIKSIFGQAMSLSSSQERAAYLQQACAGDPVLLAEIESLLQADRQAGSFLGEREQRSVATVDDPIRERPGTVIGPYKLVEQIGEGGMGIVWMAQQTEPVKRAVAVKLIKLGMDSKQVLARFEAERQALALMDHPNIARVLDAGTTENRRPFFVMELVKGVPITKYCDDHRLTPKQRLELFVSVCQAVQHAHQKGIIHRDIKPSNILVAQYDGRPVPKVIDFGVAKAAGQPLTDKTLMTGFGTVVGTLEYMSPEQAESNQLDIDTRSDIYSLGVVLYELLTGSTPLDRKRLKQAALVELLRIIREEEPQKPSTRLSGSADSLPSISAQRQMEPARLTKLVRGELDWLVMKALEKDRSRRYETANGLALDIQRYLNDEPVLACPPSAWYRFRKFSRKNKAGLIAAGLILLVSVVGAGISTWQAIRATNASDAERQTRADLDSVREEKERQQKRINQELTEGLLEVAGLREKIRAAGPGDLTLHTRLRETLRAAQALAADELADSALRGRLEHLLADVKQDENDRRMIARLEEIRVQQMELEFTLEWYRTSRLSGSRLGAYDEAFREYGLPISDLSRLEEARRRLEASAIRLWLVAALDDGADNNRDLCKQLLPLALHRETDPWRKRYFAARIQNNLPELVRLASQPEALAQPSAVICMLASRLTHSNLAEATLLLRAAQRRYPTDVWINHDLGYHLYWGGDNRTAPAYLRAGEALGFFRAALAVRPDSRVLRGAVLQALWADGEFAEAVRFAREEVRRRPDDSVSYDTLGTALAWSGDWDGAIAAHRKSFDLGSTSVSTYVKLGDALARKGDLDAAIATYRKANALTPKHLLILFPLACALHARGDLDEAIAVYRSCVDINPSTPPFIISLCQALWEKGEYGEAITRYEKIAPTSNHVYSLLKLAWWLVTCPDPKFRAPTRAIAHIRKDMERSPHSKNVYRLTLGVAQYRAGDYKAAIAELQEAFRAGDRRDVAGLFLAMAHHKLGNREKAHQFYTTAIEQPLIQHKDDPKKSAQDAEEVLRFRKEAEELLKDYPEVYFSLGAVLSRRGQVDEAIPCFRQAIALNPKHMLAYCNLGFALSKQNKWDEASACLHHAIALDPESAFVRYSLGNILRDRGQLAEASAAYQDAIRLKEDYAEAHCNLGLVLKQQGQFSKALDELCRGHELGTRSPYWPYPSAQWVRYCERLLELDGKLSDILRRKTSPASSDERIELAGLCSLKRLNCAASRFYEEAFAKDPKLPNDLALVHRYNAACAAALAGCGEGEDAGKLDGCERARLRRQALDWLRADLAARRQQLEQGTDTLVSGMVETMRFWQKDADFAGVRSQEALARLPEVERSAWQKLWHEVAVLSQRKITSAKSISAEMQSSPNRVTEVSLQADPEYYSGPPPPPIVFRGKITTNGPCTVRYAFERSDGAGGPALNLTFDKAGVKEVSTQWGPGALTRGWLVLRIVAPNGVVSEKALFKIVRDK